MNLVYLLISLILGILVGFYCPFAPKLNVLGVIFLNLIKMVTIPLIFFSIIFGITNIESNKSLYKISVKAISLFLITAMMAVVIGLVTANYLRPGDIKFEHSLKPVISHKVSITDFIVDIIPTNIVSSFANNNMLQIIFLAFFFGIILNLKKESCKELIKVLHQMASILFKMIEVIMYLAPLGVFGYISTLVAEYGVNTFNIFFKIIMTIFIACFIQYIVFGILLSICGLSPFVFYRKLLPIQLIAFSTSSSKASLVPLMNLSKEKLGVSKQTSRFILPLSSSLNMDGGAIYQAVCVVFFSQLLNINLNILDYFILIIMCTIASIGGAGIPGGVLLFLGMVLQSVGIPMDSVLLIASIDRILDMVTTVINITGDACITLLVDKSEKTLDLDKYNSKKSNKMFNNPNTKIIVQVMYSLCINPENDVSETVKILSNNDVKDDVLKIIDNILQKQIEINSFIESKLRDDWRLERVSRIVLAILQTAIYELDHIEKKNIGETIRKYLNLTQNFGHKQEGGFVNFILDSYCHRFDSNSDVSTNLVDYKNKRKTN